MHSALLTLAALVFERPLKTKYTLLKTSID